jgi:hypothetical protein
MTSGPECWAAFDANYDRLLEIKPRFVTENVLIVAPGPLHGASGAKPMGSAPGGGSSVGQA